ncbi:MAG: WYL domain-containing protein [Cyclonatronaceae bacterium]
MKTSDVPVETIPHWQPSVSTENQLPNPMVKRYLLLTEKISNDWYPSFADLKAFLREHDIAISARTLQRDIRHIRNEYGVEIEYDHKRRGYAINRGKSLDVNAFLRFMGMVRTADILTDSLRSSRETMHYLHFDSVHLFAGREHIKPLLQAIRDRRVVGFTYQKFDRDEPSHVLFRPYLLREYQYRWYLVGIPEKTAESESQRRSENIAAQTDSLEPKNYGLDRITRLDVLPETFERTDEAHVREHYDHTVGVNFNAGDPVSVIIRCTELTGKYLETLPIHDSQQVLEKEEMYWRIRFRVVPNFEFEQKLLMHLYQIEVLEPQWFRRKFVQGIRQAVNRYEQDDSQEN